MHPTNASKDSPPPKERLRFHISTYDEHEQSPQKAAVDSAHTGGGWDWVMTRRSLRCRIVSESFALDYAPEPDLWISPLLLSVHIQYRFLCWSLHSLLNANIVMFIRTIIIFYSVITVSRLVKCMESELCFPIRLDNLNHGGGDFDNDVESSNGKYIISIQAFQQELVLELQQDSNFIGPSISNQDEFWLSNTDTDLSRCFYSGYVNADRFSYAALSLCKGLQGAFGFQGWEYFVSPAQNDTRSAEGAHIIRRRASNNLKLNSTSRCAVDSDISLQLVQSLEKYRRLQDYNNVTETMLRRMGRAKRFASVPRYVETLVAADESMAQFHGDDLKHYLLTLMSVAARLYKHPSILNSISIVVVKIVIITEEDKGPKVSGNAAMTLRNFCAWQKKMNKNSDKHADYWDTAILFTRQVNSCTLIQFTWCDTMFLSANNIIFNKSLDRNTVNGLNVILCSTNILIFAPHTLHLWWTCRHLAHIVQPTDVITFWQWVWGTEEMTWAEESNSFDCSSLLLGGSFYGLGTHLSVHSEIFGKWLKVKDEVITQIHWSVNYGELSWFYLRLRTWNKAHKWAKHGKNPSCLHIYLCLKNRINDFK